MHSYKLKDIILYRNPSKKWLHRVAAENTTQQLKLPHTAGLHGTFDAKKRSVGILNILELNHTGALESCFKYIKLTSESSGPKLHKKCFQACSNASILAVWLTLLTRSYSQSPCGFVCFFHRCSTLVRQWTPVGLAPIFLGLEPWLI